MRKGLRTVYVYDVDSTVRYLTRRKGHTMRFSKFDEAESMARVSPMYWRMWHEASGFQWADMVVGIIALIFIKLYYPNHMRNILDSLW